MGKAWRDGSEAARAVFAEADDILGDTLGAPLSELCFNGPSERLNQTDVSQPAIFACSIACHRGLVERDGVEWLSFQGELLLPVTELALVGRHNIANALAALALGLAIDLPMASMLDELREFSGLPHRCQLVAEQPPARSS